MKLIIPSECQVINRQYSIKFSENMLRSADARAQADHLMEVIRLSKERTDTQKFEGLIHEAIECVNDCINLDMQHEAITTLAPILAQFLASLGIEPDFSQVQEEKI